MSDDVGGHRPPPPGAPGQVYQQPYGEQPDGQPQGPDGQPQGPYGQQPDGQPHSPYGQQPYPQPSGPAPGQPPYGQHQGPHGQPGGQPQGPYGQQAYAQQSPSQPQGPAPAPYGQQPWAGAQPGYPGAPPGYGYPAKPSPGGFAVASLVLGIIGVVTGLIPILFLISLPCGLIGLILGLVGYKRAATRTMRKWGVALSTVALLLGVLGVVIVAGAFEELDDDLDCLSEAGTSAEIDACD
jgi:hypothetical protein